MSTQVDASTISAGQLFSTSTFEIPDYQREYSWNSTEEVKEFWQDLSKALKEGQYFLGLLILTSTSDRKSVVDGQQRLLTLSVLANVIRLQALKYNRTLVAQTMRDMFLFTPNYESETRETKIRVISDMDREIFETLLSMESSDAPIPNGDSNILAAHKYFSERFDEVLNPDKAALLLSQWARLLSNGINFALFIHPDANAAFKVFEVVNTRGKDLTPAQLIKSYLISSVPEENRREVYDRWVAIEDAFRARDLLSQLTQFVRHSVILRSGYVIPRDLYQEITKTYRGKQAVEGFLSYLELTMPTYLRIADPYSEENEDEVDSRVFIIVDQLGISTIRPILLALSELKDRRHGYEELLRIVVPRAVSGTFGTGSVERAFAKAAVQIAESKDWRNGIQSLAALRPSRGDFAAKLETKPMNRWLAHVLRSSLVQDEVVPELNSYVHIIRPRYANWPGFSDDEFRLVGTTLGNYILSTEDRRPHGSYTPEEVKAKLIPTAPDSELVTEHNFGEWTAKDVREWNRIIAKKLTELWFSEARDEA